MLNVICWDDHSKAGHKIYCSFSNTGASAVVKGFLTRSATAFSMLCVVPQLHR